jgi:hypothetical protein
MLYGQVWCWAVESLPSECLWEHPKYYQYEFPGFPMEFRLIYQGPLLSSNRSRVKHKHQIRRKIHRQLKQLWEEHPAINRIPKTWRHYHDAKENTQEVRSGLDDLVDRYTKHGFRFAPLINPHYGLVCSLEILFLRRGSPGGLIEATDIDNRIKTLLDALKVPEHAEELGGATPQREEDPFFCLLSDDALITEIKIVTDRLLVPEEDASEELVKTEELEDGCKTAESKVYMVIHVKTMTSDPHRAYIEMSL